MDKTYAPVTTAQELTEALAKCRAAQEKFAAYTQEQVDKIMSYNPPLPPGGEGDGKPEPPVTPEKRIRKASLQTKTKLPITNAEDIERYLEGLRQQLERLLVDQDGVMIIK